MTSAPSFEVQRNDRPPIARSPARDPKAVIGRWSRSHLLAAVTGGCPLEIAGELTVSDRRPRNILLRRRTAIATARRTAKRKHPEVSQVAQMGPDVANPGFSAGASNCDCGIFRHDCFPLKSRRIVLETGRE